MGSQGGEHPSSVLWVAWPHSLKILSIWPTLLPPIDSFGDLNICLSRLSTLCSPLINPPSVIIFSTLRQSPRMVISRQLVLSSFATQRICDNVWRHFCLSQLQERKGCYGISWVEARGSGKHLVVHRMVLPQRIMWSKMLAVPRRETLPYCPWRCF